MRLAVIVLIASLGVTPALADDKAKAAAHYKQGNAYRNAKQYDKAITEFEAAYAIDKLPIHLFNIADAYLAKQELAKAIEYYERYLAADPATKRGAEVRGLIAALTKQKADADAAAEKKRLEGEQTNKRIAATSRVKQAEAYEQAGSWTKAGDEHRAAFAIDGEVTHLLAAAGAYRKQPDLGKAREAYLAYLEKVPLGAESDKVRGEVAAITREIEKSDEAERQRRLRLEESRATDERRRKDEAAKVVVVAAPPAKSRRNSIGVELRGGSYSTGTFATQNPSMEVRNKAGPAVGVGVFVDFPLLTASHVHFGLRARTFKSSFEACPPTVTCPSGVSAAHAGPALTLEPSLYHRGRLDVYAVLGFTLSLPLGAATASFAGAQDQSLGRKPLAEPELGLGVRFGSVSINVTFQVAVTKFGGDINSSINSGNYDFGRSFGVLATAGWTLPR